MNDDVARVTRGDTLEHAVMQFPVSRRLIYRPAVGNVFQTGAKY